MINKKSQAWFLDFIVSMIIATVALLIYLNLSTNIQNRGMEKMNELNFDARLISSNLVSAGIPNNWYQIYPTTYPVIIGISDGNSILNQDKINDFFEMNIDDYAATKGRFYSEFDYYVYFVKMEECAGEKYSCIYKVYSNPNYNRNGTGHPNIAENYPEDPNCIIGTFYCFDEFRNYIINLDNINPKNLVRYERSLIFENKQIKMVVLVWN